MKKIAEKFNLFIDNMFPYRYVVISAVVIFIFIIGIVLYCDRHWALKDVCQVCIGLMIFVTLFFTALNYEFSNKKTKSDQAILTYNIASEWYKSPLNDYQGKSIAFEKRFIDSKPNRTRRDFFLYIDDINNLVYKETLKGILNHLETVAIAANRGLIDKDFIKLFHSSMSREYYIWYKFYIDFEREKKKQEDMWLEFTKLCEQWHSDLISLNSKNELNSPLISEL